MHKDGDEIPVADLPVIIYVDDVWGYRVGYSSHVSYGWPPSEYKMTNTHSEVEREVRTLSSSYPRFALFVSGYELDDSGSISGRDYRDQSRSGAGDRIFWPPDTVWR